MKKSWKAGIFAILILLIALGVGIWYQHTKAVDHTAPQNEAEAVSTETEAEAASTETEVEAASAETEDTDSTSSEDVPEEAADQIPESDEDMQEEESDAPSGDDDALAPKEEAESETRTEEPFVFNPHLYSPTIGSVCGDEYWEGLYNLIDALRAGEDTFQCASWEVYRWCANPARLGDFYIPGTFALQDLFKLPEDAFQDGTGKIVYAMEKDAWREKAAAFEKDVMEVINEYVKPDYTDFEKCLALLDYITSTCVYDYNDDMWQGSFCQPLYEHSGICTNFGHYYAYLLRQCGVDAWAIENDSFSQYPGYHCWTYAVVDGVGYHIDPTWLLRSDSSDGNLWLTYFMMTDQDRIDYGFDSGSFWLYAYPEIDAKCTDDRFAPLHRGYYERIDRENKILYYNVDGVTEEFHYIIE